MTAFESDWQRTLHQSLANAQCNLDPRTLASLQDRKPAPVSAWGADTSPAAASWSLGGDPMMGGTTTWDRGGGGGGFVTEFDPRNTNGMARQIQMCMAEITSLRKTLAAEQEQRNIAVNAAVRKAKDEMQVELATAEMKSRAHVTEIEALINQKLQAAEHARAMERKRADDGVKNVKFQERAYREGVEQIRDEMTALSNKLDSSMAAVKQTRAEINQQFEAERAGLAQRLDLELQRYEERSRQRDVAMQEVRNSVTKEMQEVQKVAREYVRQVWDERLESMNRHINDKLGNMKQAQDMQTGIIVDIGNKMLSTRDEMKIELQEGIKDVKMRMHKLEVDGPLLNTRMDRFERKAEILIERTNHNDEGVEAIKSGLEKLQNTATKMNERLCVNETLTLDLEGRMEKLERSTVVLQHVEINRQAIDNLRKDVERLTYNFASVKDIANNDEKAIDNMKRVMDAACERVDIAEKKASKVATRFEACEQLVNSFRDRLAASEQHFDSLHAAVEQDGLSLKEVAQTTEKHARKLAAIVEKSDMIDAQWRNKTAGYDQRFDKITDTVANVETAIVTLTNSVDRNDRRIVALDTSNTRVTDQVADFASTIEQNQKDLQMMDKRVVEARATVERAEKTIEGRVREMFATVDALQEKYDSTDRRMINLVETSEHRLSERLERVETSSSTLGEKGKERDRQMATFGAVVERLESEFAQEVKELRSRADKLRNQVEEQLKVSDGAVRTAELRAHESEKACQMIDQKLVSLTRDLSHLNSEIVTEIRRKVELIDGRVQQMYQTLDRVQQLQQAALSYEDVSNTAEACVNRGLKRIEGMVQSLVGLSIGGGGGVTPELSSSMMMLGSPAPHLSAHFADPVQTAAVSPPAAATVSKRSSAGGILKPAALNEKLVAPQVGGKHQLSSSMTSVTSTTSSTVAAATAASPRSTVTAAIGSARKSSKSAEPAAVEKSPAVAAAPAPAATAAKTQPAVTEPVKKAEEKPAPAKETKPAEPAQKDSKPEPQPQETKPAPTSVPEKERKTPSPQPTPTPAVAAAAAPPVSDEVTKKTPEKQQPTPEKQPPPPPTSAAAGTKSSTPPPVGPATHTGSKAASDFDEDDEADAQKKKPATPPPPAAAVKPHDFDAESGEESSVKPPPPTTAAAPRSGSTTPPPPLAAAAKPADIKSSIQMIPPDDSDEDSPAKPKPAAKPLGLPKTKGSSTEELDNLCGTSDEEMIKSARKRSMDLAAAAAAAAAAKPAAKPVSPVPAAPAAAPAAPAPTAKPGAPAAKAPPKFVPSDSEGFGFSSDDAAGGGGGGAGKAPTGKYVPGASDSEGLNEILAGLSSDDSKTKAPLPKKPPTTTSAPPVSKPAPAAAATGAKPKAAALMESMKKKIESDFDSEEDPKPAGKPSAAAVAAAKHSFDEDSDEDAKKAKVAKPRTMSAEVTQAAVKRREADGDSDEDTDEGMTPYAKAQQKKRSTPSNSSKHSSGSSSLTLKSNSTKSGKTASSTGTKVLDGDDMAAALDMFAKPAASGAGQASDSGDGGKGKGRPKSML